MNLRKDHYRFARPVAGARATRRLRTAEGRRAGLFPPPGPVAVVLPRTSPARRGAGGRFPPLRPEARACGRFSSRDAPPTAQNTSPGQDLVPTGRAFPVSPPLGDTPRHPGLPELRGADGAGGSDVGAPSRGSGTRPVHRARSDTRNLNPKRGSGGLRPPPHAARPRVPNSPPSFGGRRGVQCLPAPPRRGSERPGVLSSSPFQTRLVSERWQPLCGVKTHKKSCDNS